LNKVDTHTGQAGRNGEMGFHAAQYVPDFSLRQRTRHNLLVIPGEALYHGNATPIRNTQPGTRWVAVAKAWHEWRWRCLPGCRRHRQMKTRNSARASKIKECGLAQGPNEAVEEHLRPAFFITRDAVPSLCGEFGISVPMLL
jgi:hypothetical protein